MGSTQVHVICRRPSVCRQLSSVCLSVTFVRPTQPAETFSNISTPFGTLAIRWHPHKILRRSSQGNPSVGWGVITQEGYPNIAILDPSKCISRKRCKMGGKGKGKGKAKHLYSALHGIQTTLKRSGKLVLITNTKSHISFWLVPNSVTLNDLERRNLVVLGAHYVKVV